MLDNLKKTMKSTWKKYKVKWNKVKYNNTACWNKKHLTNILLRREKLKVIIKLNTTHIETRAKPKSYLREAWWKLETTLPTFFKIIYEKICHWLFSNHKKCKNPFFLSFFSKVQKLKIIPIIIHFLKKFQGARPLL